MVATKAQKAAAARARANRHPQAQLPLETAIDIAANDPQPPNSIVVDDSDDDLDDCGYDGGVNVDCESLYELSTDECEGSDAESLAELEGDELDNNLEVWSKKHAAPTPYEDLLRTKSAKE